MKTKTYLRREAGFTLLELLVGLALASIVVSAVAQFYITEHYNLTQQMDVADVQQNLRSALQEMTEQIRMAGYGLPRDMDPIVAVNANPDSILFYYRKSQTSHAELTQNMANTLDIIRCNGFDLSEFRDHSWAYIFDAAAKSGEFFYMSDVDNATKEIAHPLMPLSKSYPSGSEVIAVEILRYYLDRTDPAHPNLVRSRQGEGAVVFSEGIDSLQFRYQLTSGVWTDAPAAGRLVRAVRISVSALGKGDTDGVLKGTRHRSLSSQVNIRNLAM
jgi:prepilin-type N-terminal cleavage/methylation domain-containing protein